MARSAQFLEKVRDMPTKLSQAYSKQYPSAAKSKAKSLQGAAQRRLGGAARMQQSPGKTPSRMPPPKKSSPKPSDKMESMKQKVKAAASKSPRGKVNAGQVKSQLSAMTAGKK